MQIGRSFPAVFESEESKNTYFTWSAAQMLVYNGKAQEQQYFETFAKRYCPPPVLSEKNKKKKADEKAAPKITGKVKQKRIIVECYGKETVWPTREEAIEHYEVLVANSSGAEQARYAEVLKQLAEGRKECTDRFVEPTAIQNRILQTCRVQHPEFFGCDMRSCNEERPQPDQKYAHLLNKGTFDWLSEVPSSVFGIGAYLWLKAWKRFLKVKVKGRVSGKPRPHKIRNGDRHLTLTDNLFQFEPINKHTFRVLLGREGKPQATLLVRAHRPFRTPKMLNITHTNQSLTVGFSYDDPSIPDPDPQELVKQLAQMPKEELLAATAGIHRGLSYPVMATECDSKSRVQADKEYVKSVSDMLKGYDYREIEKERIERQEVRRKKLQRQLARSQEGSANRAKLIKKIAKTFEYERNVRKNFAHQVSHDIATRPDAKLFVMADLDIQKMTARPDPIYDEVTKKPLHNGAERKSRLNRKILSCNWGNLGTYLDYKARQNGKLLIKIPAKDTSLTCCKCGCVDKRNKTKAGLFHCIQCGHEESIAGNAAELLRMSGVGKILSSEWALKEKKKIGFRRKSKAAQSEQDAQETIHP